MRTRSIVICTAALLLLAAWGCNSVDDRMGYEGAGVPDAATTAFAPPPEAPDGSATVNETLCASYECPPEYGTCGGSYKCGVDLRSNDEHCGACDSPCETEMPKAFHARWTCSGGACRMRCTSPGGLLSNAEETNEYADCNGSVEDGCEILIAGCDSTNCGGCGIACKEGEHCALGVCESCPEGTERCNDTCPFRREDFCTSIATDKRNCGACGRICRNVLRDEGVPIRSGQDDVCRAGECEVACRSGFADCNGDQDDGCEVYISSDTNNCGACGVACAPGESCNDGACCSGAACFCEEGQAACPMPNGSIVCVDLDSNLHHCGACGNECPGQEEPQFGTDTPPTHVKVSCILGRCARDCEPGFADCNGDGQCRDLRRDPYNCGACGQACELGQPCIEGACALKPCSGTQQ